MVSVKQQLENARKDLIDQGLRNPLISYKALRTRGVELVDTLSSEVFDRLVKSEVRLFFSPDYRKDLIGEKYLQEGPILPEFFNPKIQSLMYYLALGYEIKILDEDDIETYEMIDDGNSSLSTPYSTNVLQKRLRSTYRTAKIYLEENGVNVLYLAVGMLKWFETDSTDTPRYAPLVLIPVEIDRESVDTNFSITYSGDTLGGNLALQQYLKDKFEFELPMLDDYINYDEGEGFDAVDVDLNLYFDAVKEKVIAVDDWEIQTDEIVVGFFSYSKFLMYADLSEENWSEYSKPSQHPLLKKLLGDGFSASFDNTVRDYAPQEIDEYLSPNQHFHVMDADSSQAAAIKSIVDENNVVIQGPPGTGKSQTISNIIAEMIARGKTVLFVAEKLAALEVVKRRLDSIDIGDLCLELHSHKARKKTVLNELQRTLSLGAPLESEHLQLDSSIQKNREQLNEYSRAVNQQIKDSNVTTYFAYGKYLEFKKKLSNVQEPLWREETVVEWTKETYIDKRNIVENLQNWICQNGIPENDPFWDCNIQTVLPNTSSDLQRFATASIECCESIIDLLKSLNLNISLEDIASIRMLKNTCEVGISATEISNLKTVNWESSALYEQSQDISNVIEAGRQIQSVKAKYEGVLLDEVWNKDISNLKETAEKFANNPVRILFPGYQRFKSELKSLYVDSPSNTAGDRSEVVTDVLKAQQLSKEITSETSMMNEVFGTLWKEENSDWKSLEIVMSLIVDDVLEFLPRILQVPDNQKVLSVLKKIVIELSDYESYLIEINKILLQQDGDKFIHDTNMKNQLEQLRTWLLNTDKLSESQSLKYYLSQLKDSNLGDFLNKVIAWQDADKYLKDFFEYHYYMQLVKFAMLDRQALEYFDKREHEQNVQQFRKHDKLLAVQNRYKILKSHHASKPNNYGIGQVGILRREFEKKSRHKPIRKLLLEAGNAIQALKPVFMMSPMSVATYLPPDIVKFDIVIFDEASQIMPADALGSILRAEQMVVVGDSRQLPPTSFFNKVREAEDDDTYTTNLESILGLAVAQGMKEQMLRWHYRSEHESLIAVSNQEFYGNRLKVFPTPISDTPDYLGIKYHYLENTYYESGRGRRYNLGEADAVISRTLVHVKNTPDLTLGIAAFSQAQAQAIIDRIEVVRRENPELDNFFSSHPNEPFFVKNLENVQGDERDVILISVGYGKQKDGSLSLNFGPLNKDGGERRLNVLITRARKRCEIFTNLRHEDIDLQRTTASGMKSLKVYLKYAETGDLEIPVVTGREPDSIFEEQVADRLVDLGYEIHYQIGSSGFFIDLAVVDADFPGSYLLGIECDGASYHSSASARERDRLRQDILESKGWNIYRIWSTEWFKSPEAELEKLIEAINEAKIKRDNKPKSTYETNNQNDSIKIDRVSDDAQTVNQEYEMRGYELVKLDSYSASDIKDVPRTHLRKLIIETIYVEAPIHIELVTRVVVDALGFSRTGRKIKDRIDEEIKLVVQTESLIELEEGFLMNIENVVVPRSRENLPSHYRDVTLISQLELIEVAKHIVNHSFGIDRSQLAKEICYTFGFKRVTSAMENYISEYISRWVNHGDFLDSDGLIILPN